VQTFLQIGDPIPSRAIRDHEKYRFYLILGARAGLGRGSENNELILFSGEKIGGGDVVYVSKRWLTSPRRRKGKISTRRRRLGREAREGTFSLILLLGQESGAEKEARHSLKRRVLEGGKGSSPDKPQRRNKYLFS